MVYLLHVNEGWIKNNQLHRPNVVMSSVEKAWELIRMDVAAAHESLMRCGCAEINGYQTHISV
jgi:hypothetical protein